MVTCWFSYTALYLRTQMQSKLEYYETGLEVSEFVFKQT